MNPADLNAFLGMLQMTPRMERESNGREVAKQILKI
jgi:hypothetical protein